MNTPPDPAALGEFLRITFYLLGVLASLIAGAVGIRKLLAKAEPLQVAPSPLQIQQAPTYVTAVEHHQVREELYDFRREVRARFVELTKERDEASEKIHTRITEVAVAMGKIQGQLEQIVRQLEPGS